MPSIAGTATKTVASAVTNRATNTANNLIGQGKSQIYSLIFGAGKYAVDRNEIGNNLGDRKNYGIFGLPPSFLHTTDYIPKGFDYGRNFIENILVDGALLSLIPGVPDFLTELTKEQKEQILKQLEKAEEADIKTLDAILDGKHARYYSLKPDLAHYFNYVNAILNQMAVLLGISEIPGLGKTFKWIKHEGFNFYDYQNHEAMQAFYDLNSFDKSVSFYMDAQQSDAREDFGNSTTQSSLAGLAKGITDKVREAQFVTAGKVNDLSMLNENARNEAADPGLFKTLKDTQHVITSGGNLVFPEIWADSSLNKSYSMSFKLQSPSGAREDIFLYILVPYVHLLCMVAPRQITANGFISPFLVRAFCKGWFNCDLGIIESMTITRGQDGAWSYDGFPTEVNITISIKDLYSSFSINDASDVAMFHSNIGLIDHIATMCGINIHTVEAKRAIMSYLSSFISVGFIDTAVRTTIENLVYKSKTSWLGRIFSIGKG